MIEDWTVIVVINLEKDNTHVKQTQGEHLSLNKINSEWNLYKSDTAVITSNGSTAMIINNYYKKK